MNYQQQAACNQELGRLQGVLNNLASLKHVERELQDLANLEAESAEDQEMQNMALQERRTLEERVS